MGHVTEHSSSGSDSDSELSDIQLQPRPTAQLLVRRHSQQQQCLASMDFSQLSDSEINEDDDDNEECDMDDVDVEYVEPMSSGCQQYHPDVKRRRKMRRMPSVDRVSKIGGNGVQLEAAGVEAAGKRVDDTQKKNISVLFQPQSALISENMKVRYWSVWCDAGVGGSLPCEHVSREFVSCIMKTYDIMMRSLLQCEMSMMMSLLLL